MLVGGKTIQHYLCKYNKKGGAPKAGSIVVVDELSEVQLHTWAQLAQWKLLGVRFIFAGDLDGQFKPIFDQWEDVMRAKDLRLSRFLHEMCGGLHIKLTVYRRGTDDTLFKSYTALYKYADDKRLEVVEHWVANVQQRYPLKDEEIDHHFVLSHKKRILINAVMNQKLAARQPHTLFLKSPGHIPGMMMQPQDMHVWEGMELLCYNRKYAAKSPVNGGVYVVLSWDAETITVRLHEDYRQNFAKDLPKPAAPKKEEGESDEEDATSEPDDFGEEDEPPAQKPPKGYKFVDMADLVGFYTLTHTQAAKMFRPQHALVYANIQGRTMREKHIALLDTYNLKFSVRHLIVATSRATHGKYVHLPDSKQEAKILDEAKAMATKKVPQQPPNLAPGPGKPVARRSEVAFATAAEWLEYSQNRGVLVEQLYKRPHWRESLKIASEKNDLRKKLLNMTPQDVADLLVLLDAT